MNTCQKLYTDEDINHEPLPLDLVAANEYVRTRVKDHPDRGQLSIDVKIRYNTLTYFALNPGSTLRISDLQLLMEHFGILAPTSAAA